MKEEMRSVFCANSRLMKCLGMAMLFVVMGIATSVSGAEEKLGHKLIIDNQTKMVLWPELGVRWIDGGSGYVDFKDKPADVGGSYTEYVTNLGRIGEYDFNGQLVGTRVYIHYAKSKDSKERSRFDSFYLKANTKGTLMHRDASIDYEIQYDGQDVYRVKFTEK